MHQTYIYLVIFAIVWLVEINSFPLHDSDESYLGDRIYREPSAATGKLIESWNETSNMYPELGEYFEGDIILPKAGFRNGILRESRKWPNGEIPYQIDGSFSSYSLNKINLAINMFHKYTCLKFRQRTSSDTYYLSIVNRKPGCSSTVGFGWEPKVNLETPKCMRVGVIIHELMHAAGFWHEQSRFERDDYVTIVWKNIKPGMGDNFKMTDEKNTGYGVPYDYDSIMHYPSNAFTVNGGPTIIPKDPSKRIGQRDGFSIGDVMKINQMYKCPYKTAQVIGSALSQFSDHYISIVEITK